MSIQKILFLFFFSLLGLQSITAQITTANKAIIYYFDGSIFVGHIVAEDALQMQLIAVTLDTININKAYIKRILRNSEHILLHQGGKYHYTKGNFVSLSWGGGGGDGNGNFELDLILGKRFDKKLSVGIGTGISHHSNWSANGFWLDCGFIPVFGYGRYYLRHKKARIFAAAKLGYGIASDWNFGNVHDGGIYFQPSIGVHFASRKRTRLVFTIGQTLQHTKGTRFTWDALGNEVRFNYKYLFNRTVFKIGLEFK